MGWCVLLSVVSLSIILAQACRPRVPKVLRETAQKHGDLAQKCTLFLSFVAFCSPRKSRKQFSRMHCCGGEKAFIS